MASTPASLKLLSYSPILPALQAIVRAQPHDDIWEDVLLRLRSRVWPCDEEKIALKHVDTLDQTIQQGRSRSRIFPHPSPPPSGQISMDTLYCHRSVSDTPTSLPKPGPSFISTLCKPFQRVLPLVPLVPVVPVENPLGLVGDQVTMTSDIRRTTDEEMGRIEEIRDLQETCVVNSDPKSRDSICAHVLALAKFHLLFSCTNTRTIHTSATQYL
jgi:hypothetical protein